MTNPLLAVEDDPAIRRALCDYLRIVGWKVLEAGTLAQAQQYLQTQQLELILLDRVLPDGDGLDWLRTVRQTYHKLPVLFLTALGEERQRVAGLTCGGDDYIVKPFSLCELDARINAILRRTAGCDDTPETIPVSEFICLDPQTRAIIINREKKSSPIQIILTDKEFAVLKYLIIKRGIIVGRDELLRRVWDLEPYGINTRTVDITIVRLREKLPEDITIVTHRGQGYSINYPPST